MRDIPIFDITKINSPYNRTRLQRQAQGRRKGILYFSNYVGLGVHMRSNNGLRRVLSRKAYAARRALARNIGRSGDGRGIPLADSLRVRRIVPGGIKKDRITYEVYSTVPSRFIPAIIKKDKREGAIKKAMREVELLG